MRVTSPHCRKDAPNKLVLEQAEKILAKRVKRDQARQDREPERKQFKLQMVNGVP